MTRNDKINFMIKISLATSTLTEAELRAYYVPLSDSEVHDEYNSYMC
jgi:hypothetical protein